jgi:hypothetical protein
MQPRKQKLPRSGALSLIQEAEALGEHRVLTKVEHAVKVEPVGEFELKGIRRPLAAYNVIAASSKA